MGVLARVAPQLNIFAVGFPVGSDDRLHRGADVFDSLSGAALERLFDQAFRAMGAGRCVPPQLSDQPVALVQGITLSA